MFSPENCSGQVLTGGTSPWKNPSEQGGAAAWGGLAQTTRLSHWFVLVSGKTCRHGCFLPMSKKEVLINFHKGPKNSLSPFLNTKTDDVPSLGHIFSGQVCVSITDLCCRTNGPSEQDRGIVILPDLLHSEKQLHSPSIWGLTRPDPSQVFSRSRRSAGHPPLLTLPSTALAEVWAEAATERGAGGCR